MTIPAWLLIPPVLPLATGEDMQSHAVALLASGNKGEDIRCVMASAFDVIFQTIPHEINQFSFEGGSFDTQGGSSSRFSLNDELASVSLSKWKRVLSPRLRQDPADWPYDARSLAAWRVLLSALDILNIQTLDVCMSNRHVKSNVARITRDMSFS